VLCVGCERVCLPWKSLQCFICGEILQQYNTTVCVKKNRKIWKNAKLLKR
jgi:hypothetical protein